MSQPEVGQWCRCTPRPEVGGGSLIGRVMEVGDGYIRLRPEAGDDDETTVVTLDDYEIEPTPDR